MFKKIAPIKVNLRLFDEGGAAAAPAAGGEPGGAAAGSTTVGQGTAPDNKGAKPVIVYGKQSDQTIDNTEKPPVTEGQAAAVQKTPEQRAQDYQKFRAEHKDLFDAEVQNIINKRFRETKTLETNIASMNPIIEVLSERYGTTDLNILASKVRAESIETLAEAANMTVEQYEETMNLRSENRKLREKQANEDAEAALNAQVAGWWKEAADITGTSEKPGPYPTFDLRTEIQNDQFLSLLKSGVTAKAAYEVIHMQEILANTAQTVAKKTEEGVIDNIKARGNRPDEAAAKGGSQGVIFKADVSKLTKEDRAEIARRVQSGEDIKF